MIYELNCDHCGRDFEAKRPHARYCSDTCRARDWKRDGGTAGQEPGERVLALAKQPTDLERCLTALKAVGPAGLHSHTMRRRGLTGNPSARITELEELGYEIHHEREHKGRRPGTRYTLVAEPSSEAKAA